MTVIEKKQVGAAALTTVAGSMTPTVPGAGQTFSVAEDSGYPATGKFVVKINRGLSDEEKILCASRAGTVFTVELRGYDDTVAQAHSGGSTCEHALDAATVQALVDHVDGVEADPHSTTLLNNARHDVTARHTFGAALGTPGTPEALTPDIAGSAGVGSVPARADHVHNVPAAPATTLTGSNSEGVAATFARADHDHAIGTGVINSANIFDGAVDTAELASNAVTTPKIADDAVTQAKTAAAKGIIARQTLTTISSAFTSPSDSDFVLSNVSVLDTRLYRVHLKTQLVPSDLSNWTVLLTADDGVSTVGVDRFWRGPEAGGNGHTCDTSVLWAPATDTFTLRVRQALASGAGTLTYSANAATDDTAVRRSFWVEDIGPR